MGLLPYGRCWCHLMSAAAAAAVAAAAAAAAGAWPVCIFPRPSGLLAHGRGCRGFLAILSRGSWCKAPAADQLLSNKNMETGVGPPLRHRLSRIPPPRRRPTCVWACLPLSRTSLTPAALCTTCPSRTWSRMRLRYCESEGGGSRHAPPRVNQLPPGRATWSKHMSGLCTALHHPQPQVLHGRRGPHDQQLHSGAPCLCGVGDAHERDVCAHLPAAPRAGPGHAGYVHV